VTHLYIGNSINILQFYILLVKITQIERLVKYQHLHGISLTNSSVARHASSYVSFILLCVILLGSSVSFHYLMYFVSKLLRI